MSYHDGVLTITLSVSLLIQIVGGWIGIGLFVMFANRQLAKLGQDLDKAFDTTLSELERGTVDGP